MAAPDLPAVVGLSGVVYGALLNHELAWLQLGASAHNPPYKAPPKAPVLAVRPRHMLAHDGQAIGVPKDAPGVWVGASLGIVIGRQAQRLRAGDALQHVAGYVVAGELALPSEAADQHYRPNVRRLARDGFCPLSHSVTPAAAVTNPDALASRVSIDGQVAQSSTTAQRVRPVAALLVDVTAFMTLLPGDVLLLGASAAPPLARAGQRIRIEIDGVGALEHALTLEAHPA